MKVMISNFIFVWLLLGIVAYLFTLLESKMVTGKVFGNTLYNELVYMGVAILLGGVTLAAIIIHIGNNTDEQ